VIVGWEELPALQGRVTMVDGGFDPLHPGHIDYFRAAADLGAPVLCNVSSDDWVARKHAPLLTQAERAALVDAIRYVDYTHLAATTTVDVLGRLRPSAYAKGDDWRDRLPAEELEVCALAGIEVVFLSTVSLSSSAILERYRLQDGALERT
jgi:cytidyltransferase-like protein